MTIFSSLGAAEKEGFEFFSEEHPVTEFLLVRKKINGTWQLALARKTEFQGQRYLDRMRFMR